MTGASSRANDTLARPAGAPLLPSWAGIAVAAVAAFVLAACGSTPMRTADEPEAGSGARPAQPPSAATPGGGGYYKDDGPGANPPADLDSIPDAQPRREPLHRYANRPYNVLGRRYVPAVALAPFRERGLASWYGRRFHGKPTSSGEPYDMYAMSAAHPTLPIPSYVRVTNLRNGRSVVVRVNDRGPFHKDRVIDLSYTAAYRLGYVNTGSTMVEVEVILPDGEGAYAVAAAPAQPAPGADAGAAAPGAEREPMRSGVFLQLGAFSSLDNAEDLRGTVIRTFAALADRLTLRSDGGRFRLHAGPYASVAEAQAAARELTAALGLRPFVVTP